MRIFNLLKPMFPFDEKNVMTVREGGQTYTFIDSGYETNLDWGANHEPLEQNLEHVTIEDAHATYEFDGSEDPSSIQGSSSQKAFEKATDLYNQLREEIRVAKRTEYAAGLKRSKLMK